MVIETDVMPGFFVFETNLFGCVSIIVMGEAPGA
jgi:hypothetical protein